MSKDMDKFENCIADAYMRQISSLWNFWYEKNSDSKYDIVIDFFKALGLPKRKKEKRCIPYYETYDLIKKDHLAVQQALERINSTDLRAVYDKYLSEHMFEWFSSYILHDVVKGLDRVSRQKILEGMLELAKTKQDAEDIYKFLDKAYKANVDLNVPDGEYTYLDSLIEEGAK